MFLILSQVWETSNKWLKCLSSLEFHNPLKSQSGLSVSNHDSENSMELQETGISYKSPYYSLVKICHKMTSLLGNQWHHRVCVCVCARTHTHVHISCSVMSNSFATPWTVAHHAPLSMGISKQEYWSGCHFCLQGIFPTQGLDPVSCTTGGFFTIGATREAKQCHYHPSIQPPFQDYIDGSCILTAYCIYFMAPSEIKGEQMNTPNALFPHLQWLHWGTILHLPNKSFISSQTLFWCPPPLQLDKEL